MTREEAIKILKEDGCSDCTWGCESPLTCDNEVCLLPEAINMAIKALEQEIKRDKDCEWGRMTFDVISGISEFEFSDGTIKRVKQAELEPCDDAISRKAVKEALRDRVGKSISECINAIPPINLILCEDAISRQDAHNLMRSLTRWCVRSEDGKFNNVGLLYDDVMFGIDKLPSVTPSRHKGRWIDREEYDVDRWKCSECGRTEQWQERFCPNCGAEMFESQESEDKE